MPKTERFFHKQKIDEGKSDEDEDESSDDDHEQFSDGSIDERDLELLASSDDEAPESVGLADSRQTEQDKVQEALKAIRDKHNEKKRQRSERNEKFVQQKKAKLDFQVEPKEDLTANVKDKSKKKIVTKSELKPTLDEDSVEGSESGDDIVSELSDCLSDNEVEFMAFNKSGDIKVVNFNDDWKTAQTSAEKALAFRQQRFITGIKREPTTLVLGKQQKQATWRR